MTTDTQATDLESADVAPLLAAMRKGDPASCRGFVAHFEKPLYNYLYWLTGDPETAADLFQQTMLAVYRNLGRVRKDASAETWVYGQATQRYLDQGRRRQQKKRSSWDNILKGGLPSAKDEKWSQWDDTPPEDGDAVSDRTPFLVDALKDLSPRERAAILLALRSPVSPTAIAPCLQLSRRATERALLQAFDRLAEGVTATPAAVNTDVPKGMRTRIRRDLMGRLSAGRQRKLQTTIDAAEACQTLQGEEQAAWAAIQRLPELQPPATLVDDTEAFLRAGQEAHEVLIANWGFRFMQVTVPIFILIFIAIILLPAITRSREAARVAAASGNLETLGQALLAYSEQSNGHHLPPMADIRGLWVPDLRLLYPRYIKDPATLVRPSLNDPELVKAMTAALTQTPPDYDRAHELLARSYVYTGYVLLSDHDMNTFTNARFALKDINLEDKIETAKKNFIRLGKGVEVFFTTKYNDPQAVANTRATIPVLFETFSSIGFARDPDGANVLYLDGHVDYVRFGTQFPVTERVQTLLEEHRPDARR